MENSRSLEAVVGDNVRRWRLELGLTLNDVAVELRRLGLPWSTGRLGNIEAGRGTASLQVVLGLAVALTDAQQGAPRLHVTPRDLVASDSPVQLSGSVFLTSDGYAALWAGERPVSAMDLVGGRERVRDRATRYLEWMESLPPGVTHEQVVEAYEHFDLADARAQKKLGLDSDDFVVWCIRLWGRVLSAEVAMRAPAGATPQKKGRITRELLAELQEAMSRGDD